jgi:hypothetical protein
MKDILTNYFTYLKKQDEYSISFEKLKTLVKPYFKDLTNYEFYENTFIECLIPAIYYFKNEKLERRIYTMLYLVYKESEDRIRKEVNGIDKNKYLEISNEISKVRSSYKFLNYFNDSKKEISEIKTFHKDVYQFLKDTDIWKIKSQEEDPDEYFWQVEWDIEYFQILNIVYHLFDLEEINDVYNLIWILWLMQINAKGVHPEAKLIWENLPQWKEIMNRYLNK